MTKIYQPRRLLLSEYILKDISKKFNIEYKSLSNRIRISQGLDSAGVLEVTLTSNNQDDLNLLKDKSSIR